MAHRIVVVTAFAAASLLATGAYAGSPYYDTTGQAPVQHSARSSDAVASPSALSGSAAAADEQSSQTVAMPKMDPDGFEHREGDRSFYEHAVGTDGSEAESTAAAAPAAPQADPVYTAQMPKMDPDGFEHRESGSSLYNHAVGTDGAP